MDDYREDKKMTEKQWLVYILECRDGTLYTGITDDLPRRLSVHGTPRGAKYTRGRGPFILRFTESCDSYSQALRREYAIKKMTKQQKETLILHAQYST